jgi:hypothetical protein
MPPAGGVAVLDLEWGAEQHALGSYEKMGGRFMRTFVTEWREGQWWGMAL